MGCYIPLMIEDFLSHKDYQSIYALQGALMRLKRYFNGELKLQGKQTLSESMGEIHKEGLSVLLRARYGVDMEKPYIVVDAKRVGLRLKRQGLGWPDALQDFQNTISEYSHELVSHEDMHPVEPGLVESMDGMSVDCIHTGLLLRMGARR